MTRFSDFLVAALVGAQLALAAPAPLKERDAPAGLRGSLSLQGYSSSNGVVNENTDAIDYKLADGQGTTAATVGQYIDMSDVE